MTIDFYGKAKSKRKHGQPRGWLAAWFTNRVSFAFTAPLTLDECAERLNENRVIKRLQVANSWVRQKPAYGVSQTRDDVDRLSFTIVERRLVSRSYELTIQYKIEGNIRSIDSQTVFVEGKIVYYVMVGYLLVVTLAALFAVGLITLGFPISGSTACITCSADAFLLVFPTTILCSEFTTNYLIKTTRLALIRDIFEAKQKFSREEQGESSDEDSTRSTSTSATS